MTSSLPQEQHTFSSADILPTFRSLCFFNFSVADLFILFFSSGMTSPGVLQSTFHFMVAQSITITIITLEDIAKAISLQFSRTVITSMELTRVIGIRRKSFRSWRRSGRMALNTMEGGRTITKMTSLTDRGTASAAEVVLSNLWFGEGHMCQWKNRCLQ